LILNNLEAGEKGGRINLNLSSTYEKHRLIGGCFFFADHFHSDPYYLTPITCEVLNLPPRSETK
jgi:hypothetical protein